MKTKLNNVALLLIAVLFVAVLAGHPVLARGENSGSGSSGSSSSSDDDSNDHDEDEDEHGDEVEDEDHDDDSSKDVSRKLRQFRVNGAAELSNMRKKHGKHTHAQRMKICENREKTINNKVGAFGNHAVKYLERLDTIFTKVQNYQLEKQLPVSNYDELLQTTNAKQSDAATAVAALKLVAVNIDCSAEDPAAGLSTVKQAAHDARDALKAYRSALKDMVKALIQASSTTTSDDSGEDN